MTWGAESYCGVPLLDSSGACVGHLAIMDDKPMLDGLRGLAILRIFAARARAEIERLHAEAAHQPTPSVRRWSGPSPPREPPLGPRAEPSPRRPRGEPRKLRPLRPSPGLFPTRSS